MEWRRLGRCETCGGEEEVVVKPSDFAVPPNGTLVCAMCDPAEHEAFARGLVGFGDEIGHKPS